MNKLPEIAFFGSSLVSSYWNGAATYYRGIVKGMAARGYPITFYEPDAYGRQENRDIDDPDWATVVVYRNDDAGVHRALEAARGADIVIKASGVGVFDEFLESAVVAFMRPRTAIVFWDVDAPATLARIAGDPRDPFRALVPAFDLVLTYGGGDPVVRGYRSFGAKQCVPIYNALDPETHYEVAADPRFVADLALLANRLPDRERRIGEFFVRPAELLPHRRFLLGGNGWANAPLPRNVARLGHVPTADHNALNCSARAVLNVARDSMARTGFSPATRVFEAAGAAACLITDAWNGIEHFLEPGSEVLVARDGDEVVELLAGLTSERARRIGNAARLRVLAKHTYAHRAEELDRVLRAAGGAS